MAFIRRETKRCPAIILAANRIARVSGRISLLIVSIITIKGIKITGVLLGIKCTSVLDVLFNQEYINVANHRGSDIIRVLDMCEKLVNVKGSNPWMFKIIIMKNKEIIIINISGVLLIKFLNSFLIYIISFW